MNFISLAEYLKSNSIEDSLQVWSLNSKLKKYWRLGVIKNGSVWSGMIQVTLDPENMFIKKT